MHRIVRHASGVVAVGNDAPGPLLLVQFCMDRRGLWLQVASGMRGIHVNGRPVRRMAMLRAGDAVYVDGVELLIQAPARPMPLFGEYKDSHVNDPRMLLRGVGGSHHGRSFTLGPARLIGRSRDADIRIDDPSFAERHARLERHGDQVLLRDLGSVEGSLVNGVRMRDAVLVAGDQIVFDAQHRFVLEVPLLPAVHAERPEDGQAAGPEEGQLVARYGLPSAKRWPWLLLAALLLAVTLSVLLLFGAR